MEQANNNWLFVGALVKCLPQKEGITCVKDLNKSQVTEHLSISFKHCVGSRLGDRYLASFPKS